MAFHSGGRAYGGGVVQQVGAAGWVWARRMAPRGRRPAPVCVCIPFASRAQALAAWWVLRRQGWQVWPRPGKRTGAVAEVKLALPAGWSLAQVRGVLAWLG